MHAFANKPASERKANAFYGCRGCLSEVSTLPLVAVVVVTVLLLREYRARRSSAPPAGATSSDPEVNPPGFRHERGSTMFRCCLLVTLLCFIHRGNSEEGISNARRAWFSTSHKLATNKPQLPVFSQLFVCVPHSADCFPSEWLKSVSMSVKISKAGFHRSPLALYGLFYVCLSCFDVKCDVWLLEIFTTEFSGAQQSRKSTLY